MNDDAAHPFLKAASMCGLTLTGGKPTILIACSPAAWGAYHVVVDHESKEQFLLKCMQCGYNNFKNKTDAGGGVVALLDFDGVVILDCGHHRDAEGRSLLVMKRSEKEEMADKDFFALIEQIRDHHLGAQIEQREPTGWYDGEKGDDFTYEINWLDGDEMPATGLETAKKVMAACRERKEHRLRNTAVSFSVEVQNPRTKEWYFSLIESDGTGRVVMSLTRNKEFLKRIFGKQQKAN